MKHIRTLTAAAALLAASGAAHAADVYSPSGSTKDSVAPAANTWTGFYAGINGGYGWDREAKFNFENALDDPDSISTALSPSGWLGGVTVGANWQVGGVVLGVETDVDLTSIDADGSVRCASASDCADSDSSKSTIKWLGTARVRAGIPVGAVLVYGTGGFAYGGIDMRATVDGDKFSSHETRLGWTAGGGTEWKMTPSWSLGAEYLYVDLDSDSLKLAGDEDIKTNRQASTLDILRLKLNYKIGTDLRNPLH